ncbi:MAG TPA: SDR family NAD(P)-dependent oxidoreductase [Anaerolineales bacterium]|nr:SDR family NAD(P)-dependent oxidoreductase [Anaerolineales bacterium]
MPSEKPSVPRATPLHPEVRGLIIGASSGIGAALARRLIAAGYTLALVSQREEELRALCSEINSAAGKTAAVPYVHDVTQYEEAPGLLRQIVSDLGGLDFAAYVAGVNYPPGLDQYNFENDRKMIDVNVTGAIAWLNPIAEMFQSAGRGQIVGISSVAGDRGRIGNPGYNASKAALSTYLEALRNRLTRRGVNVLTIKPGFVKTQMLAAAQKPMFPITPEKAAEDIHRAMRARKQQIYTPWFWTWIMLVVRNIPSVLFRRMSF